jgi:hypothetical protein
MNELVQGDGIFPVDAGLSASAAACYFVSIRAFAVLRGSPM